MADNPSSTPAARAVVLLIAGGVVARGVFAATTGLGVDETYMVAVGRHWELGYFDHPPLAWWLAHAAAALAGSEADWVVRAPFIALFAVSTWLMFRLGALLFGKTAGLIAALALNAAPVLGVTTGTWVLPDGPLDASLLAAALCLAQALLVPKAPPTLWLAAGLFGGLALLSKFHGVFLFFGAGLFLLTSAPHRGWLARPWPYLGALVALVIASPGIVWNIDHHWASLAFQGARAAARVFRPWMPFVALAGQAVFLAPWIWAPLAWAGWRDLRRGPADPRSWLLVCLAAGPILLFTLAPAWSDQRPYFHWAAPGWMMLLPLLGRAMAPAIEAGSARGRLWLKASLAFDLVAVAGLVAVSLAPVLLSPFGPADPLAEMADWSGVGPYLSTQPPAGFVVARRWYEAAKIDHALAGRLDVICLGDDCRGYDFIAPDHPLAGGDATIFLPENALAALPVIAARFERVEPMPDLTIARGPLTVARLKVFRGVKFGN